jgi:putative pyruvate formate lyase activating enzyme
LAAPLEACALCPRQCGANRTSRRTGYCGAGREAVVYRSAPHHGEEPPVSGTRGSGTVFFSHCTLRCLYCQNYPWSQQHAGRAHDAASLGAVFRALYDRACHNWNLVSPTPWLPQVREALAPLWAQGVRLPIVYNTSGYERVETLEACADLADVYLPDLRYARAQTAAQGSGRGDYVEVARAAVRHMWRTRGPLELDDDGVAQRGVICRILVLPGHADEAVTTLEWLAREFGTGIAVSVMSQYLPAYRAAARGDEWARGVTREEYADVQDAVAQLGFETGWVQEYGGAPPGELVGYRMRRAS